MDEGEKRTEAQRPGAAGCAGPGKPGHRMCLRADTTATKSGWHKE